MYHYYLIPLITGSQSLADRIEAFLSSFNDLPNLVESIFIYYFVSHIIYVTSSGNKDYLINHARIENLKTIVEKRFSIYFHILFCFVRIHPTSLACRKDNSTYHINVHLFLDLESHLDRGLLVYRKQTHGILQPRSLLHYLYNI